LLAVFLWHKRRNEDLGEGADDSWVYMLDTDDGPKGASKRTSKGSRNSKREVQDQDDGEDQGMDFADRDDLRYEQPLDNDDDYDHSGSGSDSGRHPRSSPPKLRHHRQWTHTDLDGTVEPRIHKKDSPYRV